MMQEAKKAKNGQNSKVAQADASPQDQTKVRRSVEKADDKIVLDDLHLVRLHCHAHQEASAQQLE